jgi:hypothetical protein
MLAKYDVSTQIEIIESSMRNNYQGLFPPNNNNGGGSKTRQPESQLTAVSQFRDEEAEKLF